MAIYWFLEGLTEFDSALASLQLGLVLAIAIAIHNIPEGMVVAMPIHAATGSRRKAVLATFLAEIAEPMGTLIGALFLVPCLTAEFTSYLLAGVGVVTVFISLDELLPSAHRVCEEHPIILRAIVGTIIVTVGLALLVWQ